VTAFLSVLLALSVHPWPVGPGARYQPPTGANSAAGLACGPKTSSFRAHLELFAGRKVIVVRGRTLTVGDLFRVWGQPLGPHSLAGFTSRTAVRAYVAGRLVKGPVRAIPLTPHAQIVLELGGYVPPHPFFLFPGGD
jgi:hypothetical protein